MRKNVLRLLALMLALTMALSLGACEQDTPAPSNQGNIPQAQKPAETEPVQSEPMVLMYIYKEEFSGDDHYQWVWDADCFSKQELRAKVYLLDSNGDKYLYAEEFYSKDLCTQVIYQDGIQTTSNTARYQNGKCVYVCIEYLSESAQTDGLLLNVNEYTYDEFGRYLTWASTLEYRDAENNDHSIVEYIYQDDGSGFLGIDANGNGLAEVFYDNQYRLRYFGSAESYRSEYTYNRAGSMLTSELFLFGKSVSLTEYEYEAIEVPLSIAQKWPMFKWEYID